MMNFYILALDADDPDMKDIQFTERGITVSDVESEDLPIFLKTECKQ